MLVNIHNHSEYSPDAYFPVSEMLKSAEKNNVEIFAITDHCDMNEADKVDLIERMKKSTTAINEAKKRATVKLLCGIELGEPTENPELAKKILNTFEFDFVIGSVHSVKDYSDYYYANYIDMTDEEIYSLFEAYYKTTLDVIEFGDFDTLAHITYPYRYLNKAKKSTDRVYKMSYTDFDNYVETIFKKLIQKDLSLELNIGSLLNSNEDVEMENYYFKKYYAMGGRNVTIGVDAHAPEYVNIGIEKGYKLLKDIGFTCVNYYENRAKKSVTI